jgi:hypothetical protein
MDLMTAGPYFKVQARSKSQVMEIFAKKRASRINRKGVIKTEFPSGDEFSLP